MKDAIRDIQTVTTDIAQDLSGYATRAAMNTLTSNWIDAVNDGNPDFNLANARGDIDDVIKQLTAIRLRLTDDPLAERKMRVALGVEVPFPSWDSLSDDARHSWINDYRGRNEHLSADEDVTSDAKADYERNYGIEPPHPLAYTR